MSTVRNSEREMAAVSIIFLLFIVGLVCGFVVIPSLLVLGVYVGLRKLLLGFVKISKTEMCVFLLFTIALFVSIALRLNPVKVLSLCFLFLYIYILFSTVKEYRYCELYRKVISEDKDVQRYIQNCDLLCKNIKDIDFKSKLSYTYVCNDLNEYRRVSGWSVQKFVAWLKDEYDEKDLSLYIDDWNKFDSVVSPFKNELKEYNDFVANINQYQTPIVKKRSFNKRLRNELLSKCIKIVDEAYVTNTVTYTSPAGRNYYSKTVKYPLEDVANCLNGASTDKESDDVIHLTIAELFDAVSAFKKDEFKKAERAAMTPGLRYDVMKRDGFKCVLCGRGVNDGVQLEVDHIIPIAKGGRTEMSNLQTLCRDCNRGKGTKEM